MSPPCTNPHTLTAAMAPLSGAVERWGWRCPQIPMDCPGCSWALSSPPPLSPGSKFTEPASCKWHFIRWKCESCQERWAPSRLSEIHYQLGIRQRLVPCAVPARRIMNNENSTDRRQTQLTGRASLQPPSHSVSCDTPAPARVSTSPSRAGIRVQRGWGCAPHSLSSLPGLPLGFPCPAKVAFRRNL